jgi:D-xylose 1-dehydrogenase (NADP+, D-xylono-1,5-lactone-forming)
MPSHSILEIGILGAANIARQFIDAVRPSAHVHVRAVASRDMARGRAFADALGVPVVHASYEDLLADPSVDAIYNPLPNTLHAEWSIRAAAARKHVLCEKPLCLSSTEATAIFEAARANGVYVVEGYPYRCQPQTIALRRLLRERAIGRLQTLQASFGFTLEDKTNIRFDPALGGGALMDAGSYPVSLVRMIAGERAAQVHAFARWSDTGVDETLMGTIEHPSGLLAQISCSFRTARHRRATIVGDQGTISTSYFNDTSAAMPPLIDITRGVGWDAPRETISLPATSGFLAEAEGFAALVREGWSAWPGVTPEESTDIVMALDALVESARTCRPVTLGRP